MSSILTNTSAMVALQTLNTINKNLAMTQNEISTGKSIANAKDNSAVWAISQVMQSDVDGFEAINSSLKLGQSTVAVGRNASEQVSNLIGQIKEKIVAAQEDNVDRAKLQTDVDSLRDQIAGIVSAAQFNGQNLLENTSSGATFADIAADAANDNSMFVLSSLDRDASGNVASNNISVVKQDLGTGSATAGALSLDAGSVTVANTDVNDGDTTQIYQIVGDTATADRNAAVMAGDGYELSLSAFGATGTTSVTYVARHGETAGDIAAELASKANNLLANQGLGDQFTFAVNSDGTSIDITNNSGTDVTGLAAGDITLSGGGTAGGGLEDLASMDVSTADGAAAALASIEKLQQTAIDSAAAFGTGEKRLEIQADFVSNLVDSMKAGIGSLVDADMEAASARLQALQVQQQLGIQALSIANQAPQNVLSLFR